jgi:predicted nucleotidyltransferase
MDKRKALEKAKKFSELVIKKYNPKKIILFGSYARGTYRNDSDIDIMVVFDKIEGSFLEKEVDLYKLRRTIDENIEPVLYEEKNDPSGFLESVSDYGEVLYQRVYSADE